MAIRFFFMREKPVHSHLNIFIDTLYKFLEASRIVFISKKKKKKKKKFFLIKINEIRFLKNCSKTHSTIVAHSTICYQNYIQGFPSRQKIQVWFGFLVY